MRENCNKKKEKKNMCRGVFFLAFIDFVVIHKKYECGLSLAQGKNVTFKKNFLDRSADVYEVKLL